MLQLIWLEDAADDAFMEGLRVDGQRRVAAKTVKKPAAKPAKKIVKTKAATAKAKPAKKVAPKPATAKAKAAKAIVKKTKAAKKIVTAKHAKELASN